MEILGQKILLPGVLYHSPFVINHSCPFLQVHFAATKDSLSRHFNKFGDVLKVVILTDAATGQPKGLGFLYASPDLLFELYPSWIM